MQKRVAVVLPAFNEEAGLEKLIWRIVRALDGIDYVVVVVDDGSTDRTAEIAEDLARQLPIHLIRHEENAGYGAGIRTGLLAARRMAAAVVTMDADDSHDPLLITLMLHGIACGSDVIVASRFVPGGREVGVPFHRKILSHGAALVFGRLLKIDHIHDYTSGYRTYRSTFLDDLVELLGDEKFIQEEGFTVGVELLLKADRAGGRLAEVPLVLRYDRKVSDSKLKIAQTLREYVDLLKRVPDRRIGRPADEAPRPKRVMGQGILTTVGSDVGAVFLAFAISFGIYTTLIRMGIVTQGYPDPFQYAGLASLLALTTVSTFLRFGLYAPRLSVLHLGHLQLVSEAFTVSVALFFAILFLGALAHPSRLLVAGAIVLSFPIMLVARGAITAWLRGRRVRAATANRVLIYGAGHVGRLLAKKVFEAPRLGSRIVGFLDDTEPRGTVIAFRRRQLDGSLEETKVLGSGSDLARVVSETGATELFVAIPELGIERLNVLRAEADALGLELGIVPRLGAVRPDQLTVDDLGSIPVLRMHHDEPSMGYGLSKRLMDVSLVVLAAPLAIPLGLMTALLVAVDGRPVLFRQTRIGLRGRPFTVLKFRTMHPDVDPYETSPIADTDPRITKIGRLVRTAGLDELPQLVNVLRGEMSLVGPRPEMPQIVASYTELERQRLAVRPGITGLWQLSPDRSAAIHENLEYDLYYLRQRKLSFDLLIIGETVLFVVRALARSVVGAVRAMLQPGRVRLPRRSASVHEEFVLVALDQRRRPDEPASWTDCIPKAVSLALECPVKLVVAEKNASRMHELAGHGNGRAGPHLLEYVSYGQRDDVTDLAGDARVVVTDLDYVADWASENGVDVFHLQDDHRSIAATTSESALRLVRRVEATFGASHLGQTFVH